MDKKNIIIKLENYNGRNITFVMPKSAAVNSLMEMDEKTQKVERIEITALYNDGIEVIIEEGDSLDGV